MALALLERNPVRRDHSTSIFRRAEGCLDHETAEGDCARVRPLGPQRAGAVHWAAGFLAGLWSAMGAWEPQHGFPMVRVTLLGLLRDSGQDLHLTPSCASWGHCVGVAKAILASMAMTIQRALSPPSLATQRPGSWRHLRARHLPQITQRQVAEARLSLHSSSFTALYRDARSATPSRASASPLSWAWSSSQGWGFWRFLFSLKPPVVTSRTSDTHTPISPHSKA